MNWQFWKPKEVIKYVPYEMDEIELSSKLAHLMGDIESVDITSDGSKDIFRALASIDGLADYLRDTMVNDIKRYFAAQNDKERDIIRGGFSRTSFLRAQILAQLRG